jgi:hypothetical protein
VRKRFIVSGVAASAMLLATSAFAAASRGATFTSIGFINDTDPYPASSVWDMNPQGTVFLVSPSIFADYYVEWTREAGWGAPIGSTFGIARVAPGSGVGRDTHGGANLRERRDSQLVVMANGIYPGSDPEFPWPALWTGVEDGWNPIPSPDEFSPCGDALLTGYGIGGQGDYITGLTWQGCSVARAFKWDKATNTTVDLGTPNGRSTRGNAITSDGKKVIGWGTMLFGIRRGARFENGTVSFLADPNALEPFTCAKAGTPCTANNADPGYGCPGEYVDDGFCANYGACQDAGTCVSNACSGGSNPGAFCVVDSQCLGACVGGSNPGTACGSNNDCSGTCVGPNAGAACWSDYDCPDTPACTNNPKWTDDMFKGEAYDVTPNGRYAVGSSFDYNLHWNSGYRANPDGTFTEMPPPATWPYYVIPFRISADGKTAVGRLGTFYDGYSAFFWHEGIGTIDLQLFMEAQGIADMSNWYLFQTNTVSADGTVIAGFGYDPDGMLEGWIIDIKKIWICHAPSGHSRDERTLGVDLDGVAAHLAHGDSLGTCEYLHSGAAPQANAKRRAVMSHATLSSSSVPPDESSAQSTPWTPFTRPTPSTGSSSHDR